MDYITSDYYFFYATASLDRRFIRNYKLTNKTINNKIFNSFIIN